LAIFVSGARLGDILDVSARVRWCGVSLADVRLTAVCRCDVVGLAIFWLSVLRFAIGQGVLFAVVLGTVGSGTVRAVFASTVRCGLRSEVCAHVRRGGVR